MNRLIYLSALILIAFSMASNAQSLNYGIIKGMVINTTGTPLPFATIVLESPVDSIYKTSKSDAQGVFNFIGIIPGDYALEIRMVGFDNYKNLNLHIDKTDSAVNLGTIILTPSSKTLQEVVIKGQTPLVEKQIDKTVINVDQSITNNGTTAFELMQKLPGVRMTADGQVSLNGRSGVNVMIDGKLTYLSAADLVSQLSGMPSSDIQKIELMANPSAKYDAAGTGGIINIVKKKNHKEGFNGNANASVRETYYGSYNGGLNLNYKTDRYNVYLNSNYVYYKSRSRGTLTADILDGTTSSTEQVSQNIRIGSGRAVNNTLGVDLYLAKRTTLTITGNMNGRQGNDLTNSNMDVFDANYHKTSGEVFSAGNVDRPFNYTTGLQLVHKLDTAGRQLSFDADYSNYRYRPKQNNMTLLDDTAGNFIGQSDVFLDQSRSLEIYGARADYVLPLPGNGKFEAGMKSSYVKTNNNSTYYNQVGGQNIPDYTQSDYSLNTENINAAYVNLNKQYKKLTVETGLRAEQTITTGKQIITAQSFLQNYVQLFPTLFVNYKLNDHNAFNFQFGRRTERADYHELVPFRRPLTPTLYFEGNPNLKPQTSWHAEAAWSYQNALFITFSFDIDRDYIRTLPFLDSNKVTSTRMPINIQGAHTWELDVSYNKQITPWWSTNNTISIYQNSSSGRVNGFSLENGGIPSVELNMNDNFTINDKLSAQADFEYDSKRQFVSSTYGAYSILSFGIKRQLFNKKVSISINAHNVLQSESHNQVDHYQNLNQYSYGYFYTRSITLSINYRFGAGKLSKIQSKSGSEEERKRAGN
jgi:hypothetical protein